MADSERQADQEQQADEAVGTRRDATADFPVVDVTDWEPAAEPATRGEDDKAWLLSPRAGPAVLFKPVVFTQRVSTPG